MFSIQSPDIEHAPAYAEPIGTILSFGEDPRSPGIPKSPFQIKKDDEYWRPAYLMSSFPTANKPGSPF